MSLSAGPEFRISPCSTAMAALEPLDSPLRTSITLSPRSSPQVSFLHAVHDPQWSIPPRSYFESPVAAVSCFPARCAVIDVIGWMMDEAAACFNAAVIIVMLKLT